MRQAAISPDGGRIATCSNDQTARIWDPVTGQELTPPLKHNAIPSRVAFSPNGLSLLTATMDGTQRVWDAATGQPITPPLRQCGARCAAFGPQGRLLFTASRDGMVRIYDLATGQPTTLFKDVRSPTDGASFSPDGRRLVTVNRTRARVWDATTGQPVTPDLLHSNLVNHASFSPDGRFVVTAGLDAAARVWDATTGRPVTQPLKHSYPVLHVAFSPDSRRVVSSSGPFYFASDDPVRVEGGEARIWETATGEPVCPPLRHKRAVWWASFNFDGSRASTASLDATARVWDVATGAALTPPLKHGYVVHRAAFSPGGRRLVTASSDHTARLWDIATGEPLTAPLQHSGWVADASFSPDGRRVVSASWGDESARIWDAKTGQLSIPPLKHQREVFAAAFSRDGRRVLTISNDKTARIWDSAIGAPLTPALHHFEGVAGGELSPDGRRVLTQSNEAAVRLWDLATEVRPTEDLQEFAQLFAGQRIDDTGGFQPLQLREICDLWERLRSRYPDDFLASDRQVMGWHWHEAETLERAGQWSEAVSHLNHLIAAEPNRWYLWIARGRAHAELGQWAKAVADYTRAAKLGADEYQALFSLARLHMMLGDQDGYRKTCARLLDRLGKTEEQDTANDLAWICSLAPGAASDPRAPLQLAEKAERGSSILRFPRNPASRSTLGAAQFRAGHFERAVQTLTEVVQASDQGGTNSEWLLLSMAHQRLGHADEARKCWTNGVQQIPMGGPGKLVHPARPSWEKQLDWQVLCREAEVLLTGMRPPE